MGILIWSGYNCRVKNENRLEIMLNNTQQKRYNAVIMAGGGGTRLWPWSRKEKPKQMLTIVGDRTMFQTTVDRLDSLISYENIYVVTTAEQAKQLEIQVPEIAEDNYLLEPLPKGTASVIGISCDFDEIVLTSRFIS